MKRTVTVTTDDLDGSDIADERHRSTTLALDDQVVVLDLNPEHREQLAAVLAPYLEAGRKVRTQAGVRVSKVTMLPATKPGKRKAKKPRARVNARSPHAEA